MESKNSLTLVGVRHFFFVATCWCQSFSPWNESPCWMFVLLGLCLPLFVWGWPPTSLDFFASRHTGGTRAEEPSQRAGEDESRRTQSAAQGRHDERHVRRTGERCSWTPPSSRTHHSTGSHKDEVIWIILEVIDRNIEEWKLNRYLVASKVQNTSLKMQ